MRMIGVAMVVACLSGVFAPALAFDANEPRVLLGEDAAILASGIAAAAGMGVKPGADVAVVLFEPAGFVHLVLIDTVARRKTWTRMSVVSFEKMLRGLSERA